MRRSIYILVVFAGLVTTSCLAQSKKKYPDPKIVDSKHVYPMQLSDGEWKKRLTTEQYTILRKEGTERAGTGKYENNEQKGVYYSAASLQPVFSSEAKFHS